jgi:hypothetical protein
MPPETRTLNKKELDALTKAYKDAERRILATFEGATDFSQARRAEQLAQINAILTDLGRATGEWADFMVFEQYEKGASEAIRQLQRLKVGIKDTSTMSTIDRRAVAALVSETQASFGAALTTVSKNAESVLSQAVREAMQAELIEGRILGSTRREISRRIKAAMEADGITALTDKRGARWKLDRYAEMLARTKMTESRNTGLANKMVANGFDLVEVSDHMSNHQQCAAYEGKILSLTGKTDGYPTLADAKMNGLFHPNCEHQINVIRKNYAELTTAYDPRSGTYKQPFKNNPPEPPKTEIKLPPTAPKSAKPAHKLTFTPSRGKPVDYAINRIEEETMRLGGIQHGVAIPGGRWGQGTLGQYREWYRGGLNRGLFVRDPAAKSAKKTFYHEMGHALDFNVRRIAAGGDKDSVWGDMLLSKTQPVRDAIRADKEAVYARRVRDNYDGKGLTDEQVNQVLAGEPVVYDGVYKGRPTKMRAQIDARWKRYAMDDKEIFADGYGQWRLDPEDFKRRAPELTKIYEGVNDGSIK